jgi:hypothetical protein
MTLHVERAETPKSDLKIRTGRTSNLTYERLLEKETGNM